MTDADRRKLVATNLANGLRVDEVMVALRMSEAEVLADLRFALRKITSYRFERKMPVVRLESLADLIANRVPALHSLSRVNLATDPAFTRVVHLPYRGLPTEEAEVVMQDLKHRSRREQRGT